MNYLVVIIDILLPPQFIGTFIFLSVILITGQAIPIGLILAGMVYWGGAISGGAFNPAVRGLLPTTLGQASNINSGLLNRGR